METGGHKERADTVSRLFLETHATETQIHHTPRTAFAGRVRARARAYLALSPRKIPRLGTSNHPYTNAYAEQTM